MSLPISYSLEIRRLSDKHKEAIQSSGDLESMTEDLMRMLKRMFPNPEMYRYHIENYMLPIVQEEAEG